MAADCDPGQAPQASISSPEVGVQMSSALEDSIPLHLLGLGLLAASNVV